MYRVTGQTTQSVVSTKPDLCLALILINVILNGEEGYGKIWKENGNHKAFRQLQKLLH